MPENINTSRFELNDTKSNLDSSFETMIKVENVSMVFNMASEQLNSLKEYAIKIAKRELFFEGFTAVDNVSFEIKKGDVFGIIGTNGSGKSTLLKIIAGVLEPSEGKCEINGSIAPLIELGAGFDLELTARENIYLNGALLGYSKEFIEEHFNQIVAFAEVEKFLDMPLKNYSSGMVARIAFAIATVIIPEILIVDEVLSVGDFMFQKKCEDRINELIETHGVTVLIVSHSNDQIARLCNKAIWIEKGHTRMIGAAAQVCRIYGSLGGRVGKPESEQRVFRAISADSDTEIKPYSLIAGDDFCGTSARTASLMYRDKQPETVIVACGTSHINTIFANGMASALDAPILHTKVDHIPDSVAQTLARFQPKKIFYFDCGLAGKPILDQLNSLDWNPEVSSFAGSGSIVELSEIVFNFGVDEGLWGNTLLLVGFEDNAESLAAAPFAYKERCPVFTMSSTDQIDIERVIRLAQENEFNRVVIVGSSINERIVSAFKETQLEVVHLAEPEPHSTCLAICDWIIKQNRQDKNEVGVASLSLTQWMDALSCGAYLGKANGSLLLEDPTSLDSIAACLDFVSSNKDKIEKLTFFGGDANLNALDRELLSRELS
jgi:ABC-2 type transport system ATP-binding protein